MGVNVVKSLQHHCTSTFISSAFIGTFTYKQKEYLSNESTFVNFNDLRSRNGMLFSPSTSERRILDGH